MLSFPIWGDEARRWKAISYDEKQKAIAAMQTKCKDLFRSRGFDVNSDKVVGVIEGRLWQARRGWQKSKRRKMQQSASNQDLEVELESTAPVRSRGRTNESPIDQAQGESRRHVMQVSALLQAVNEAEAGTAHTT